MAISKHPSKLSLPQVNPGVSTVLEYLIIKFPYIDEAIWQQRMADGKVHWHDGSLITAQSEFLPQQRVYYYREVEEEPIIPLHRLDRVTAGLVIFSVNPKTSQHYHELFETRQIDKTYQAIAKVDANENLIDQEWQIKNRIVKGKPSFRMQILEGSDNSIQANSHSIIRCTQQVDELALFELKPVTGKTHQLRLHMQSLGWPILNDKYYPELEPQTADNYQAPLQLLAKELEFIDPISKQPRHFIYEGNLSLTHPAVLLKN